VDSRRASVLRSHLSVAEGTETGSRAFTVSAEAVERLTAHELESALGRLPADQREALLLCDLWGFQYAEIGGIVGAPIGTVRSRIARARSRLSSLLGRTAKESKGR
jgi:RNA polymerase sigma-70 factor, ECF subfamily